MQNKDLGIHCADKFDRNVNLKYELASNEEIAESINKLKELFEIFYKLSKYPQDMKILPVGNDRDHIFYEIVVRVDKRIAYYKCFHEINTSERKIAALYAYWIIQFQPFVLVDDGFCNDHKFVCLNERFAAFLLICAMLCDKEPGDFDITVQSDLFIKLEYTFRHRCISIDSIVTMAECLTDKSFEQDFGEEKAWL